MTKKKLIVNMRTILNDKDEFIGKEVETLVHCCEDMCDAFEEGVIQFNFEWESGFGWSNGKWGLSIGSYNGITEIKYCPFCSVTIVYKDVKTVRRKKKIVTETIKRTTYDEEEVE